MIEFSLALCFSGFGALCLGLERHHEQVFGHKPGARKRHLLRLLGWLLLACAIAPAVNRLGPSIGLALWVSALSLAAVTQMLLLSYRPRAIAPLSIVAPLLALPFSLL
ncbi:membrane protein [Pseudomonas sp. 10-1B]|uniref:DUF3325 domain-containing protein n=1 Tax=Pseudomonas sp. 10-1B TaxID=1546029 RepID=UPI00061EFD61|nr:DUF3325 domain-containing protein [Pseudomonas sp. 10-1B]KIY40309.1 membrane protein [Pseudomonas sp. 10-1B]